MADTMIETGKDTAIGQRRDHNEDNMAVFPTEDGCIVCIVADGMGGHQAGEVASAIAIEVLERELTAPAADPTAALVSAIKLANADIWQASEADPDKAGMGTTVVAAVIMDGQAYFANAGDSPAFMVRGGEATAVVNEHGLVAEQVRAKIITEEQAEHHHLRHILTRCLGAEPEVDVETYEPFELLVGDVLVLASDGLTEHVKRRELPELIAALDPNQVAKDLVNEANERGGHDNITVVVARAVPAPVEEIPTLLALPEDEPEVDEGEIPTVVIDLSKIGPDDTDVADAPTVTDAPTISDAPTQTDLRPPS